MKKLLIILAMAAAASLAAAETTSPVAPIPGTSAAVPETAVQPQAEAPLVYKSMMFSESDMKRLYGSTETYRLNLSKGKNLPLPMAPASPNAQEQQTRIEHPQFFLALIAFNDVNNWTLWLNNQKYTAQTPSIGEIKVLEVEKTKARFSWRPKLFSAYARRPIAEGSQENVFIKPAEEAIEFALYPNQNFSAYTMAVSEGFLPPLKIEELLSAVKEGTQSAIGSAPSPTAPAAPVDSALPPTPTTGIYDSPGKAKVDREMQQGVH